MTNGSQSQNWHNIFVAEYRTYHIIPTTNGKNFYGKSEKPALNALKKRVRNEDWVREKIRIKI